MFVLMKRKGVGERGRELGREEGSWGERKEVGERGRKWRREEGSWGEGVEEVHEKERAGLHGVDMWTKAFDPHTCSNHQATDLENYHWERQINGKIYVFTVL